MSNIIITEFSLVEVIYSPTPHNHCVLIIMPGSPFTFQNYPISFYLNFSEFYEMMQVAGKSGNEVLELVSHEINKNGDTATTVNIEEKAFGEIYFNNLYIEAHIDTDSEFSLLYGRDFPLEVYSIDSYETKKESLIPESNYEEDLKLRLDNLYLEFIIFEKKVEAGMDEDKARLETNLIDEYLFEFAKHNFVVTNDTLNFHERNNRILLKAQNSLLLEDNGLTLSQYFELQLNLNFKVLVSRYQYYEDLVREKIPEDEARIEAELTNNPLFLIAKLLDEKFKVEGGFH